MGSEMGKHYIEIHTYEDGDIAVYRRHDYPDNWYCRVKVNADDRRYLVRSTKTSNLDRARHFAYKKYFEAAALKEHGEINKLWARPFPWVADRFLEKVAERVKAGLDSESKLKRVRFSLAKWKKYLDKPITKIKHAEIEDYEIWRRNQNGAIARTTIAHEYAVLGMTLKWAVKQGYLSEGNRPDTAYKVDRKVGEKARATCTKKEWEQLEEFMLQWMKEDHNSYIKYQRHQFVFFVILLANSGLRDGEARNLRWRDINYFAEGNRAWVYLSVDGKTGRRTAVALRRAGECISFVKHYRTTFSPSYS